jgi:DNA repair protein RadC
MNRSYSVSGILPASRGGLSGTVADIGLIYQGAIKPNASGIIVYHSHLPGKLNTG